MGFLKKLGDAGKKLTQMSDGLDPELMENGLLGLGTIEKMEDTNPNDEKAPCVFTVQVAIDGNEPYTATCTQSVSIVMLKHEKDGNPFYAVRVDPYDHNRVALDFGTDAPIVTLPAAGPGDLTAADILAKGVAARVAVEASAFLRLRNAQGVDMHTIKATVTPEDEAPYVIQFSNPVPADIVSLMKPGADLPAKVLLGNPNAVAIDWAAAKAG